MRHRGSFVPSACGLCALLAGLAGSHSPFASAAAAEGVADPSLTVHEVEQTSGNATGVRIEVPTYRSWPVLELANASATAGVTLEGRSVQVTEKGSEGPWLEAAYYGSSDYDRVARYSDATVTFGTQTPRGDGSYLVVELRSGTATVSAVLETGWVARAENRTIVEPRDGLGSSGRHGYGRDLEQPHVRTTVESGHVLVTGSFQVYLWGTSVRVQSGNDTSTHESGRIRTSFALGVPAERRVGIWIDVQDGRFSAPILRGDSRDRTVYCQNLTGSAEGEFAARRAPRSDRVAILDQGAPEPITFETVAGAIRFDVSASSNGGLRFTWAVVSEHLDVPDPLASSDSAALPTNPTGGRHAEVLTAIVAAGLLSAVAVSIIRPSAALRSALAPLRRRSTAHDLESRAAALSVLPVIGPLVGVRAYSRLVHEASPPEETRFRHDLANCYARLGRLRPAISILRNVVMNDPANDSARYDLAKALARRSRRDRALASEALSELAAAVGLNPLVARRAARDPAFRRLRRDPNTCQRFREIALHSLVPREG